MIDKALEVNFFSSKTDDIYDLNIFIHNYKNILFVTGLSGSGKSTTSRNFSKKYNAIYIELDVFFNWGIDDSYIISNEYFNKNELFKKFIYKYLHDNGYIIKIQGEFTISPKYRNMHYQERMKDVIDYCKKHRNEKYVIEGVQLYQFTDFFDIVKDYPLIIKNTSLVKSYYRSTKRDNNNTFLRILLDPANVGTKQWYLKNINLINNFSDKIKEYKRGKQMENNYSLESFLNYIFADSVHIEKEVSAMEGFFKDDKEPPKWSKSDKYQSDFCSAIKTAQLGYLVYPSAKWSKMFFEANLNITTGLKKNGPKLITNYVSYLEKALNGFKSIKDDYVQKAYDNADEELGKINTKFRNDYFSEMILYNKNFKSQIGGDPTKVDKTFLSSVEKNISSLPKSIWRGM